MSICGKFSYFIRIPSPFFIVESKLKSTTTKEMKEREQKNLVPLNNSIYIKRLQVEGKNPTLWIFICLRGLGKSHGSWIELVRKLLFPGGFNIIPPNGTRQEFTFFLYHTIFDYLSLPISRQIWGRKSSTESIKWYGKFPLVLLSRQQNNKSKNNVSDVWKEERKMFWIKTS